MKKSIALTFICLFFAAGGGWAQGDTILVAKNLELARRLMDEGRWDESVALLDDADAFDPTRTALWSYERGFARYLQGDLQAAIGEFKKAARFRDASGSVFCMLAECYDKTGKPYAALDVCARGLGKFPGSGRLFNRTGRIFSGLGEDAPALDAFVEGLVAEPLCADNWFDAAALNFVSADRAYGMVNGETAVCLEPDSERAARTCDTLAAVYRRNITFPGDTTAVSGFSSAVILGAEVPFPVVYETILSHAAAGAYTLDIPSLIAIRTRFIELWFAMELHKPYPCALFDHHRAMIEAGFFEAWNYRLFGWPPGNGAALDALTEWLERNPVFRQ